MASRGSPISAFPSIKQCIVQRWNTRVLCSYGDGIVVMMMLMEESAGGTVENYQHVAITLATGGDSCSMVLNVVRHAYTMGSAYVNFLDKTTGSLQAGKD